MRTRQIRIERLSVTSARPFESVVAALNAALGHPDMEEFARKLAAAKTYDKMERVVQPVLGKYGLMEFVHFDMGMISQKRADQVHRRVSASSWATINHAGDDAACS